MTISSRGIAEWFAGCYFRQPGVESHPCLALISP